MNKDEVLKFMVNSFKNTNVKIASDSGYPEVLAIQEIEKQTEIITKCMSELIDNLLERYPNTQIV